MRDREYTACRVCSRARPRDVDVMEVIRQGHPVRSTECILCRECRHACPTGAIG